MRPATLPKTASHTPDLDALAVVVDTETHSLESRLGNLLQNALATGATRLWINVHEIPDRISLTRFSVSDNGQGIAKPRDVFRLKDAYSGRVAFPAFTATPFSVESRPGPAHDPRLPGWKLSLSGDSFESMRQHPVTPLETDDLQPHGTRVNAFVIAGRIQFETALARVLRHYLLPVVLTPEPITIPAAHEPDPGAFLRGSRRPRVLPSLDAGFFAVSDAESEEACNLNWRGHLLKLPLPLRPHAGAYMQLRLQPTHLVHVPPFGTRVTHPGDLARLTAAATRLIYA